MSQTSIRVDTAQRDALARVAAERGESLDEALRRLVWEHECLRSLQALKDEDLADYEAESVALGNAATEVIE